MTLSKLTVAAAVVATFLCCSVGAQEGTTIIRVDPDESGLSVSLEWDSDSTLFYILERTFDLADWTELTPATLGGTGSRTVWAGPLNPAEQGEYFRVKDPTDDFLIEVADTADTNRVATLWGESGPGSDLLRTVIGVGDETGDGQRDVLFRDEVWQAPTTTVFRLRSSARDTGVGRLVQVDYGEAGSTSVWSASFTSLAADAWGSTGDVLTRSALDGMSATNLPFVESAAADGVYVRFPKTAVTNAAEITFQGAVQIVENDPLVVWYYPPLADEMRELALDAVESGEGSFRVQWEDAGAASGVGSVTYYRVRWERKAEWGWLVGETGETGLLPSTQLSYTHNGGPGRYAVRVFGEGVLGGGGPVRFVGDVAEVVVPAPPNPPGMILIPAGSFSMGDTFGEGGTDEVPVHTVYVGDFFIDRTKVTNQQMADVLQWAHGQGLVVASSTSVQNAEGAPKELLDLDDAHCQISYTGGNFVVDPGREDYPCVEVSWHGAQAYANYLSDIDGLQRCINFTTWTCDFSRTGYRLPTEAQWEKAARGGVVGRRFPWADVDTIDHSRANYYSDPAVEYDASVTNGFHSAYNTGTYPYTNPVDAFSPTGYGDGLYDMAGSASEWCWDWYSPTWYGDVGAVQPDPIGPPSAATRVQRGGSWFVNAYYNRCALRGNSFDSDTNYDVGFRCVRP